MTPRRVQTELVVPPAPQKPVQDTNGVRRPFVPYKPMKERLEEFTLAMLVPAQDDRELREQLVAITDTVVAIGELVKKMYGEMKDREKEELAEFRDQRRAKLARYQKTTYPQDAADGRKQWN